MGIATPEKKDRNEEILRLHIEGMSYNELAKKYDVSVQRIWAILKKYRKN